jgi:tetratricopeptide (TPR) repeat protein
MDLEALLARALDLGDEGDWDGMAEMLREHLAEFESEPALHCWLGVAERELGLGDVAYERFRRTLSLNPTDPYVLATAGNGLAAFDDPDAEQALRTAALTGPAVSLARYLYGAYLSREGQLELALEELTAARALEPDEAQIAYELGVALSLSGDRAGAIDAVGDAVRLDPEEGWARVVLGLLLLEDDRLEEAVGELSEGARFSPDDVEAQLLAALAAGAAGQEDLAYEMLERGRMRGVEGDMPLVLEVEERLDAGPSFARALLMEEGVPDSLRSRLAERP